MGFLPICIRRNGLLLQPFACIGLFKMKKKKVVILAHEFRCYGTVWVSKVFPNFLLQDGGLLINNPCALALHECKCLWPDAQFQCVISLGTGRYEGVGKSTATHTSLKAKLSNVISSATDTEGKQSFSGDFINIFTAFYMLPVSHTDYCK